MRKQITDRGAEVPVPADVQDWLDLEHLVQVELTSEDADHPIESALLLNDGRGWRAHRSGEQTIRLLFDKPQRIRRIQLHFQEDRQARTQEFVLRWIAGSGTAPREIVRQQYNFSPPAVSRELEDYVVDLDGLTVL